MRRRAAPDLRINGRPQWDDPESPASQADDATIFGPFGGVAPAGQAPECDNTDPRIRFRDLAATRELMG
jgi:hypothetical protein